MAGTELGTVPVAGFKLLKEIVRIALPAVAAHLYIAAR